MSQSRQTQDRIRTFVQRIERLEEEIACMNADKSEVYKEAKGEGFDLPALRLVVSERRKRAKNPDTYQETRSLFEIYMRAVGEEVGTQDATRVRDLPPPTLSGGITVISDSTVTTINETPAPTSPPADGGLPQPSAPAEPVGAASTSGSGPGASIASEGTQPADETESPSLSAPEEAACLPPQAGRKTCPSGVLADETEGDGLAGDGDGAAVATPDDDISIPDFMRRDANNRAPFMEGAD